MNLLLTCFASLDLLTDKFDEAEWFIIMRKIFKAMVQLERHKHLDPKLSNKLIKVLKIEVSSPAHPPNLQPTGSTGTHTNGSVHQE